MSKLALFVEGQTEQIFVEQLIRAVAGSHNITIDTVQGSGGGQGRKPRVYLKLQATGPVGTKYYVLIYDCSSDSRVLSDILDNYANLITNGYSAIIGLQDIYPKPTTDLPMIKAAQGKRLPITPVAPRIVFAIREIEAWFLAEYTHFQRLDPFLTDAVVSPVLGCLPNELDVENVADPALMLDAVYRLCGKRYTKLKSRVSRTVDKLSFEELYFNTTSRVPAFGEFCEILDAFLS